MASGFELEGTVKVIMDEQTFPSGFSKREFVVEVEDGKFPQLIKFECIRDHAAQLDELSEGDAVKVRFDIRGNEYKDRYYVNLTAWKVTVLDGSSSKGGSAPVEDGPPKDSTDSYFDEQSEPDDGIPF